MRRYFWFILCKLQGLQFGRKEMSEQKGLAEVDPKLLFVLKKRESQYIK